MEKRHCSLTGFKGRSLLDPETTLANLIRKQQGLTGTKVGCGKAECGACSVILNGKVGKVLRNQDEKS